MAGRIRRIFAIAAVALGILAAALAPADAQTPANPGDPPLLRGLPGHICNPNLPDFTTPEPYSSNDRHNGFVYAWSFAKQCFTLEPPIRVGDIGLAVPKDREYKP